MYGTETQSSKVQGHLPPQPPKRPGSTASLSLLGNCTVPLDSSLLWKTHAVWTATTLQVLTASRFVPAAPKSGWTIDIADIGMVTRKICIAPAWKLVALAALSIIASAIAENPALLGMLAVIAVWILVLYMSKIPIWIAEYHIHIQSFRDAQYDVKCSLSGPCLGISKSVGVLVVWEKWEPFRFMDDLAQRRTALVKSMDSARDMA